MSRDKYIGLTPKDGVAPESSNKKLKLRQKVKMKTRRVWYYEP